MGKLFETRERIDRIIAARKLDPFKTRGAIGMRIGFLVSLITAETPDDEVKLTKLRAAAEEVLGEKV